MISLIVEVKNVLYIRRFLGYVCCIAKDCFSDGCLFLSKSAFFYFFVRMRLYIKSDYCTNSIRLSVLCLSLSRLVFVIAKTRPKKHILEL